MPEQLNLVDVFDIQTTLSLPLVKAPSPFPSWYKPMKADPVRFHANAAAGLHPHGAALYAGSPMKKCRGCENIEKVPKGNGKGTAFQCALQGRQGWDSHAVRTVKSTWIACVEYDDGSPAEED